MVLFRLSNLQLYSSSNHPPIYLLCRRVEVMKSVWWISAGHRRVIDFSAALEMALWCAGMCMKLALKGGIAGIKMMN